MEVSICGTRDRLACTLDKAIFHLGKDVPSSAGRASPSFYRDESFGYPDNSSDCGYLLYKLVICDDSTDSWSQRPQTDISVENVTHSSHVQESITQETAASTKLELQSEEEYRNNLDLEIIPVTHNPLSLCGVTRCCGSLRLSQFLLSNDTRSEGSIAIVKNSTSSFFL